MASFSSCADKNSPYPVETFRTPSGKDLSITLVNHGSLAFEYRGVRIHVDPVSTFHNQTIDYSCFPKADFLFVTHEHGDHLSAPTLTMLSDEKTRILLNATSQQQAGMGEAFAPDNTAELTPHIKVQAVHAYNTTPGRERFHPKGNGFGLVFDFDGLKVYVSGDTEDIPEMSQLKDIDVAFLSANQPYTMTPQQCVHAALTIHPRVLIPYHLGDTDCEVITSGLKGSGIEVRLHEELR